MSQNDGTGEAAGLLGLPVEEATERVVAGTDRDPETVRETLAGISEEGTLTRRALEDALAELSKVVATPETRVEVARNALADAREAAAPVADTEVVRSRLAAFEADLSALEERVDALGPQLSERIERADEPGDLYATARSIRRLRAEATGAQNAVDALAADVRSFERRLTDPEQWADKLHGDVDALEESLEELLAAADRLLDAGADGSEDVQPALAWADATLQHGVRELLVADVRAELDVLEKLVEERGSDDPSDGVRARLRELEALRVEVSRRLDDAFETSWNRRYGETVASFDRTLAEFDPPVNWATLEEELERHRERLDGPE